MQQIPRALVSITGVGLVQGHSAVVGQASVCGRLDVKAQFSVARPVEAWAHVTVTTEPALQVGSDSEGINEPNRRSVRQIAERIST
jgi:hypothetical protein